MTTDYLRYYDLEAYLLSEVRSHFFRDGKLDAFDLFSIVIWKSNRSKSRFAHRLLRKCDDLEAAAAQYTSDLFTAKTAEARLILSIRDWGLRLPTASAICSILWPDEFTVYDIRVCEQLSNFQKLGELPADRLWPSYEQYCRAVSSAVPAYAALRDKDRYLWGRSTAQQLTQDIKDGFK
jgi:hypothetical protein